MDPERFRQIEDLYHAVAERSEDQRATLLARADPDLRREVESLLAQPSRLADLLAESTVTQFGAGALLGSYRIESILGAGGMGTVYRAVDTKLNRPVAIKVLSEELADAAARRRFQREAQLASSLNHPHILTVYDAGEIEGRQYLVTEYIDGGTLKDWAQREKREWRDVVELLVGVADGLATAHEAGILHRDIKPANILITKSGYAKLADFGLAKLADTPVPEDGSTRTLTDGLTRKGTVIGTIAYMSPEQASGRSLDARSDVFSFAVVLYQMLAGRRPFEGATDLEILQTIIHGAPQPLGDDIPLPVRMIVEKALEKDPVQRYQSMREMVVDLRRLMRQSADTPVSSAPTRPPPRPVPPPLTPRVKRAAAAALIVMVIAAGGAFLLFRSRPSAAPARAQYTQLTNVDSAIQPALSPDGRMLTFVRGTSTGVQSTGDPTEIYIKLLPDGDPVQLTHDRVPYKGHPRFSLDGARIAYMTLETSGFNTYVIPVIGGQEPRRLLTNGEGMNWIDDKTILFSYMTGKGVTMAVATSTESRSGERTVYVEDGIMNHQSYLSPDHKQLLVNAMEAAGDMGQCRVAPFDGSSKGKKVGPTGCSVAAWSPDGKVMYFSADTGNGSHIWRQRFPDGTPEQITSGTTEEEGVDVAPDGRSLVTSVGAFQDTIWVHDSRGDRQVTSESFSFQPTISADGKKLYYIVRTAGGLLTPYGGLWVTNLESGKRERLLPDFQMWHYNISRDGKRVVFAAPKATGRQGVWLAALDGSSAPRQLTSAFAFTAFFGADGEVFYSILETQDTSAVYRVKEDGSNLRKAIPNPAYYMNDISPDGKYIAVSVPASAQETGTGATMVYPLNGDAPVTVCICGNRAPDAPQPVSWSQDGKLFYISMVGGQAVYAIPLRAGQVVPPLPPGGIHSAEEAARLPGAKLLPAQGEFPGPNPSLYAFPKFTSQRNIFRVPVP
jgi:serine/threonine protein kinase/Tol biopolymer transport system component